MTLIPEDLPEEKHVERTRSTIVIRRDLWDYVKHKAIDKGVRPRDILEEIIERYRREEQT